MKERQRTARSCVTVQQNTAHPENSSSPGSEAFRSAVIWKPPSSLWCLIWGLPGLWDAAARGSTEQEIQLNRNTTLEEECHLCTTETLKALFHAAEFILLF